MPIALPPAVTDRGVQAALASAALFGAATPAAKLLLGSGVSPWLLAGLLYAGSGIGLLGYRLITRQPTATVPRGQRTRWAAAVLLGGVAGPVLLLAGLSHLPAAEVSLLLTAEGVLTALLAWTLFREHVTRQLIAGMALIAAGSVVLATSGSTPGLSWPALAVLGACACWALDNNLTRDLTGIDATWLAGVKGLVAGTVNLTLALATGATLPAPTITIAAGLVGLASYGISIVAFIVALRRIGTARTGAYFGLAPFIGALLSVVLGESATPGLLFAGLLMGAGTYLHLVERHGHHHLHEAITHIHEHRHDDLHHGHSHTGGATVLGSLTRHSHWHTHPAQEHAHPHFPDVHHRHTH